MFFPKNRIHIEDFFLFAHQFRWYVEHFLQSEIRWIHNGILVIQEILSHECRRIHRRGHKHSPNYWMFFSWVCNARYSFLPFSHLIFYFCCVTSHHEIFGICHFLGVGIVMLPWSFTKHPSVPYGLRISVEKSFSFMRTNLLYHTPRSIIGFPWSIVCRNLTFPLLRRPSTVIIQFWIICWREFIRLPWSIICNNKSPRILISVTSLHRAWWSWRRHDRRHPRGSIHHRSRFGCDSFFSWFVLNSLRHCSRAKCRTEMANVKQAQQMIPLITCEIRFG